MNKQYPLLMERVSREWDLEILQDNIGGSIMVKVIKIDMISIAVGLVAWGIYIKI